MVDAVANGANKVYVGVVAADTSLPRGQILTNQGSEQQVFLDHLALQLVAVALGAKAHRRHQMTATLDTRLIRRYRDGRDLYLDGLVQLCPGQEIHHHDRNDEYHYKATEHYPKPLEYLERESHVTSLSLWPNARYILQDSVGRKQSDAVG